MSVNGLPESKPYRYGGDGRSKTPEEVEAMVQGARAQAPSQLATSREARAAAPVPAMIQGTVLPPEPGPAALKGAVKVTEFPDRTPYPFAQIAADGGIWRIDPAVYKAKPESIRSAAWTWAKKKGVKSKVVIDGGQVFVQFTRDGAP